MVTLNIKSVTSMPPEAAIGQQAGAINQGSQAIAVGKQAGYQNQGANAIAIGAYAGYQNQAAGSIVLNASGANVNAVTSGFYVNPVRSVTSSSGLVSYSANEMIVTSNVIMNTVTATTFIGNGSQLTGIPTPTPLSISNVQITDDSWAVLDDLAVSTIGGYCVINGTGFAPGTTVMIGTDFATSVTYMSSTQLRIQMPNKTSGSYNMTVIRGDTSTATLPLSITYSALPVWGTSTTLSRVIQNVAFTTTLSATSDSNVTYANTTALPPQTTLSSNGTFSGNIMSVTNETLYTFSVKATDLELQDTLRTFQVSYLLPFLITDLAVSMTGSFSFVIVQNTRPSGFGDNYYGQLGVGTSGSMAHGLVPSSLMASQGSLIGKSVSSISCGSSYTMVVCTDGTLHAFGYNGSGQFGTGNTTDSSIPINIPSNGSLSGRTISKVTCSGSSTFVVCTDGTLHAFGYNGSYGQLGNGNTTNQSTPIIISNGYSLSGKSVSQVESGGGHTMALCTDNSLHVWGYNGYGQLGLGYYGAEPGYPVNISSYGSLSGRTPSKIACGGSVSIVLCTDGSLHTFGQGQYGAHGAGDTNARNTPTNISSNGSLSGKTPTRISGGYGHTAVLCTDGSLHMFGDNTYGQLGTGNKTSTSTPINITSNGSLNGKTISRIVAAYSHTLVSCTDYTLHAFGYNGNGQLGTGNTTEMITPVNITTY